LKKDQEGQNAWAAILDFCCWNSGFTFYLGLAWVHRYSPENLATAQQATRIIMSTRLMMFYHHATRSELLTMKTIG
jgi:hypothetical protein